MLYYYGEGIVKCTHRKLYIESNEEVTQLINGLFAPPRRTKLARTNMPYTEIH